MTKASRTARTLARSLRTLDPTDELARVTGGGQTASTSTSGSPEAGDDTVGDATFSSPRVAVFAAPGSF